MDERIDPPYPWLVKEGASIPRQVPATDSGGDTPGDPLYEPQPVKPKPNLLRMVPDPEGFPYG